MQAAIGFGAGLFAIPLVVLLGRTLPEAVGMTLPIVLMQTAFNVWQLRRFLHWRSSVAISIYRIASLPLGTWLMFHLAHTHVSTTRKVIGLVILGILALQSWFRVQPRTHVPWWWAMIAGVTSGVLAGAIGMGGPIVVLWVMAQDWSPLRQRMCLWLAMISIIPVQMPILVWLFGEPLRDAFWIGLALCPSAFAGAWLGGQIGNRLSRKRLRRAMICVLILIAVYNVVGR